MERRQCSVFGGIRRVYYELLKSSQIVTGDLYREQIIHLSRVLHGKRPKYETRQHKVILFHDNAQPHVTELVKETLEALRWKVATPCGLFTRLCPFRLSLASIDGTRTCTGTLQFL